jgi:hypothetical protein
MYKFLKFVTLILTTIGPEIFQLAINEPKRTEVNV